MNIYIYSINEEEEVGLNERQYDQSDSVQALAKEKEAIESAVLTS